MAKVTAPLLSFGASGQIGKAQVYGTWRGIDYARRHVVPANPRTTAQSLTRDLWRRLSTMWVMAPAELTAPWNAFALGRAFTGQNRYMGDNVVTMRGDTDMANWLTSPGVKSGFPFTAFSPSTGTGSGEIDVACTVPTAPTGWTITDVTYIAVLDEDPTELFSGPFHTEVVASAPWSGTITGLTPATDYAVSGYITWEKPNGDTAYGRSSTQIITSGA